MPWRFARLPVRPRSPYAPFLSPTRAASESARVDQKALRPMSPRANMRHHIRHAFWCSDSTHSDAYCRSADASLSLRQLWSTHTHCTITSRNTLVDCFPAGGSRCSARATLFARDQKVLWKREAYACRRTSRPHSGSDRHKMDLKAGTRFARVLAAFRPPSSPPPRPPARHHSHKKKGRDIYKRG